MSLPQSGRQEAWSQKNVLPLSPWCALTGVTAFHALILEVGSFPTWRVGVECELNKVVAGHSFIQQTRGIDFVPDILLATGYKTRSQADTVLTDPPGANIRVGVRDR